MALLRLLWAASGEGSHVPAVITRSVPDAFEVKVPDDLQDGLHRLLSGVSSKVIDELAKAARSRPAFMQPALVRDREASVQFFAAAPQRVRVRRLRNGSRATPVTAEMYRRWVIDEITAAGWLTGPSPRSATTTQY